MTHNQIDEHFDILPSSQQVNLFEKSLRNKNGKIDATKVKEYYKTGAHFTRPSGEIAMVIDELKILKSVLSKQMPSEQYNGMLNLLYILAYPNATTEEIQSALVKCEINTRCVR